MHCRSKRVDFPRVHASPNGSRDPPAGGIPHQQQALPQCHGWIQLQPSPGAGLSPAPGHPNPWIPAGHQPTAHQLHSSCHSHGARTGACWTGCKYALRESEGCLITAPITFVVSSHSLPTQRGRSFHHVLESFLFLFLSIFVCVVIFSALT